MNAANRKAANKDLTENSKGNIKIPLTITASVEDRKKYNILCKILNRKLANLVKHTLDMQVDMHMQSNKHLYS
jgi:hypothetical protein